MAVALRGSAVLPNEANPTTSLTLTIDGTVAAGDVLFLALTSRNTATTITVTDDDTGGNTWTKIHESDTSKQQTIWYKRATSGTASKTITASGMANSSSAVLKVFSGATAAEPPYADIAAESNANTDHTHAGFTPTNADSMVCCAVSNINNDLAVTSLSFATLGAPTVTEDLSTGGQDCETIFGHALQSGGPSATGNLTWTQADGVTKSVVWTIFPPQSVTHATSGTLTGPGATVAGTAALRTHHSSGVLTGPGATVAGTAVHSALHATSGVLTGPGATVVGTAAHIALHATSGELVGPGATVAGTAARTREHATEGVLVGPGSAIVGTAARTRQHDTSGVLSGPGSTLAGAAARTRQHATEGVLTGPSAEIVGVAARAAGSTTHTTSGALVGQGAVLAGSALYTPAAPAGGSVHSSGGGGGKVDLREFTYLLEVEQRVLAGVTLEEALKEQEVAPPEKKRAKPRHITAASLLRDIEIPDIAPVAAELQALKRRVLELDRLRREAEDDEEESLLLMLSEVL